MKIGVISLGCPKNLTDSEIMLGILKNDGHEIVSEVKDAEIIIVNTCGFIDAAKEESINTILEMAEYKKHNCLKLIMCGCLAQRYHDQIFDELPEVDAVVGTGDFMRISEVINACMEEKTPCLTDNFDEPIPEGLPRLVSTPPYTAYLKIADGCDNNCTYCAIPMIRGHYRSRRIEDILNEAEELVQNGVRELILIAQDTTRYGKDIYGRYSLDRLLNELCKIEDLHWIRLHYFYPEAIAEDVLDIMANNSKICRYIDMPIQHINSTLLRRMARRTDSIEIEKKIELIRKKMPDAVIRTSLICGFPGENEEMHRQLCEFVERAKLDRIGVFAYSREEGTPAALFPDQVPEDTKNSWRDEIMMIQQKISLEKNRAKLGCVLEVLCEGYDSESYMYYGRSYADSIDIDSRVYFAAEDEVPFGSFVNVEILDCDEYDLTGKMVTK